MEHFENKLYQTKINENCFLKRFPIKGLVALFLFALLSGCSEFVQIDPPKNILISETVFNDPATVESTLANALYSMREEGMVSGNFGLTTLMGTYADELDYYGFDNQWSELYHHNVVPSNTTIAAWWRQAYYLIYGANDIIKGVGDSDILDPEDKDRFRGQALFIRAYVHSLLVGLYGDIPYITTTEYLENNMATRMSEELVYGNIITDLVEAAALLENVDLGSSERVVPDFYVAKALLARMYMYNEQWALAEATSSELLDAFALEPDLDKVFLKESPETIWQLSPGENPRNTQEANQLVIQFIPGQKFALTDFLVQTFEGGDERKTHWTDSISDSDNVITLHYAHKYKALFNETESMEHSILFRLAEQYLIRAEARTQRGNILGAQQDLNTIRNRASLPDITENTVDGLLEAILRERFVELFAEQGHRWFDLKRTGNAQEILGLVKPNWQDTDILLPIPETELEINPRLLPQNPGY